MDHTDYARVLFRRIDAELAAVTETMRDGGHRSLESYREAVGVARGLASAREIARQMLTDDERQEITLRQ